MVFYHAQLVWVNLTTNEHLNRHKYPYLWDSSQHYRNPFDQGVLRNLVSRVLFPGPDSYRLPGDDDNEQVRLLPSNNEQQDDCVV